MPEKICEDTTRVCPLGAAVLAQIQLNLCTIKQGQETQGEKLDKILGYDGPLGAVQNTLENHGVRIKTVEQDLQEVKTGVRSNLEKIFDISVKMAGIGAIVYLFLQHYGG